MWSDAGKRYKTKIAEIFSAKNKLQIQLKIEATLAKVQAELGMITTEEAEKIDEATNKVRLERVKEIEAEIHHDLMAVVRALAENAGDAGEKVHLGATSNDIQDTTLALQLIKSKKAILDELDKVSNILFQLASEYRDYPCIGRTHGQWAVPTTVGFKFANFLYELQLAKEKLEETEVNYSKFSGAIGNYASTIRTDIEEKLFEKLGLQPCPISTQVVPRGIHSSYMHSLALLAATLERISKEIRNLQRSEIQEWLEPFSSKQVGSSAMPHKRNPHKSERISGMARIVRQNVSVALEDIALEHERDISHSSVERVIIPESSNILLFMAQQMNKILANLEINKDGIDRNMELAAGKAKSEQILKRLVDEVGRQEGHELLRKHANSPNFAKDILEDDNITKHIPKEELRALFEEVNTGLAEEKVENICNKYQEQWKNYRSG